MRAHLMHAWINRAGLWVSVCGIPALRAVEPRQGIPVICPACDREVQ